jgi:UDP-3-O-[3-hydroxymyristoyl] glucosamine N-acyltransferase
VVERAGGTTGLTLAEIAAAVGGTVDGDAETRIYGVSGLQDATEGSLVRVEQPRYLEKAVRGPAAALLARPDLGPLPKPSVRVEQVRLAFARCLELFTPAEARPEGIHPTAVVADGAELAEGCAVGPYAVVGAGARIGARVVLHAHVVVGEEVEIGDDSVIYPHAVIYARSVLGRRVRVHSGTVIGADGFGYEWSGERHQKIPQNGRVRLGDEVEVGANVTIDRATTGETVIGPGTKIDNLVQVGHNVRTGAHCLLISQAGIAGSASLGNGVVLAGQVGVKDHVTIGDGVQVAGRGGVWGDVPPGTVYSGNPARPHREELRVQAALHRLPELLARVRALEARLEAAEDAETGKKLTEPRG